MTGLARMQCAACAAIAAGLLLPLSAAQGQSPVNLNVPATFVFSQEVTVSFGNTYTWTTSNPSAGADPVLHLWDPTVVPLLGPSFELAQDDDSGAGLNANLTFTSWWPGTKQLLLVMRAQGTGSQGTADLTQAVLLPGAVSPITRTLGTGLPVGGALVAVPSGAQTYETAMAPGGALDPKIFLLDSDDRILAVDDDSGVGLGARISSLGGASVLVGTASENDSGPVHLYANDAAFDFDLDGLGNGLEAALGTCGTSALAGDVACVGVFNPRDTDRDGLPDGMEIFGFDHPENPQYLSRWGADPLHKDIFVEIDFRPGVATPWDNADAIRAQAIMDMGLAADLGNPDGMDGVNLHFDAGVAPAAGTPVTLLGDWGGSNEVEEDLKYEVAPESHRHPARAGIFRYALAEDGGGGQGAPAGDRLHWGANSDVETNVRLFLHELGHNLNLSHAGHSSTGGVNCKPNYRSLMNYTFMYKANVTYSQGDQGGVLDPSFVSETIGLPSGDPSYLNGEDYNRPVNGPMVDWDFSGDFWRPVRAPLTFSTNYGPGGCKVSFMNRQVLIQDTSTASPVVTRAFNRLYVFWTDANNRIRFRSSIASSADENGSCPGGDGLGDQCTVWSDGGSINTEDKAYGLAAIGFKDGLVLTYRNETGIVRELRADDIASNDYPEWREEAIVPQAVSVREPELVRMRVDPFRFAGQDEVLGMFMLTDQQRYRWHTLATLSSNWSSHGTLDLRDEDGDLISGTQSPTLASWPPFGTEDDGAVTCGAFTDDGYVSFYCYEPSSNRFSLVQDTFREVPLVSAKPGLAFRTLRESNGGPQRDNPIRGQFWLSTVDAEQTPYIWISTTHDSANNPVNLRFDATRRALMNDKWTNLQPGTGAYLYADLDLSALKGAAWRTKVKETLPRLYFLPLADGVFERQLSDLNDYRVMERGICLGLHGVFATMFCGTPETSVSGF